MNFANLATPNPLYTWSVTFSFTWNSLWCSRTYTVTACDPNEAVKAAKSKGKMKYNVPFEEIKIHNIERKTQLTESRK